MADALKKYESPWNLLPSTPPPPKPQAAAEQEEEFIRVFEPKSQVTSDEKTGSAEMCAQERVTHMKEEGDGMQKSEDGERDQMGSRRTLPRAVPDTCR